MILSDTISAAVDAYPTTASGGPADTERARLRTTVRLGWHFAELRGRLDPQVPLDPPAPITFPEHSLQLTTEFPSDLRVAELVAVVTVCAAELTLVEPEMAARMRASVPRSRADVDWPSLAAALAEWDQRFQFVLAGRSARDLAAYELGRAVAETRWALDPTAEPGSAKSWEFLLGQDRRDAIWRFMKLLVPLYETLAMAAFLKSLSVWGRVAMDSRWRAKALPRLSQQSRTWHDLLATEREATSYLSGDPLVAAWSPSRILPILSKFPVELSLLGLSLGGLLVASLFLVPLFSNPGVTHNVTEVTQGAGGPASIGSFVSLASLIAAIAAALLARARLSVHDLGARIREEAALQLIFEAILVLPVPEWPPRSEGNYLLSYPRLRLRVGAWAIDMVLMAAATIAITLLAIVTPAYFVSQEPVHTIVIAVALTVITVYNLAFTTWIGRTPGMIPYRLFVVRVEDGGCPSFLQLAGRALGWIVLPIAVVIVVADAPFVGVVDLVAVVVIAATIASGAITFRDQYRRTFYDIVAGTLLIHSRSAIYLCEGAPDEYTPALAQDLSMLERYLEP